MHGSVWLPYVLLCPALMFPPQGLGHTVIWFCQATRVGTWLLLGSGLPTHVLRYGPASEKADKSFLAEA